MGGATASSTQTKPRGQRSDYVHFRPVPTRWMDNDVYGHLNNVVYYSLFDTAVNGMLIERGLLDPHKGEQICLVVETGCSYFQSVGFPETLDAGIRVARLGNSSVRYEIGMFRKNQDDAVAEGYFIHVCVDHESRRPVALSAQHRDFLSSLVVRQPV